MVQAWYIKDEGANPPKYVSLEDIFKRSGVEYRKIDIKNADNDEALQKVRKDGGYNFEDIMEISKDLPDFKEKKQRFNMEHLHSFEETRLCLEGLAYFEIRDCNDEWIRVKFEPGDLLILPAGIYHRLSLDVRKYVKIHRFFQNSPLWEGHYRPADDLECRQQYLAKAVKGF